MPQISGAGLLDDIASFTDTNNNARFPILLGSQYGPDEVGRIHRFCRYIDAGTPPGGPTTVAGLIVGFDAPSGYLAFSVTGDVSDTTAAQVLGQLRAALTVNNAGWVHSAGQSVVALTTDGTVTADGIFEWLTTADNRATILGATTEENMFGWTLAADTGVSGGTIAAGSCFIFDRYGG